MAAKKAKAKVTKTGLSIDLSGVEASERRVKRVIPEGIYRARVDKVGPKKFSTGRRGVEWQYVITDGNPKGKGARFWNNNTFIDEDGGIMESSLWSLKGALQALSPRIKIKDSLMNIPFDKLVGRTVALEIADGEDNEGKPRSEVIDVFHEDLIESDDEEETEDEEDEETEEWDEDAEEEDEDEEDSEEETEEADEDEEEWDLDEDEL